MSIIRHIGQIGDRKAAVIFHQVPGEDHMALIVYTETMNAHLHDALMRCLESDIGQTSDDLGEALNRSYTQDGRIILHVLHSEGMIKKVRSEQVVMTPNRQNKIRLDELNNLRNEMKKGEAAIARMQEIDASAGLQDPADIARRMREGKQSPSVVSDADLATQRLQQAEKMEREARGLLIEVDRLKAEAASLLPQPEPILKPKRVTTKRVKTAASAK